MKLFLYSKLTPEINQEEFNNMNLKLVALLKGRRCTVGYIASENDPNRIYFNKAKEFYNKLGIESIFYFDLEEEYEESKVKHLFDADIIHLTSGNTYTFLNNIKKRALLSKLKEYVELGGILVGVSAGCHIMCKTIDAAKFGDENVIKLEDLNGLALVNFKVVPHWNRKKDQYEQIRALSKTDQSIIYLMEDGNGIVIEGDQTIFYGDIIKIT